MFGESRYVMPQFMKQPLHNTYTNVVTFSYFALGVMLPSSKLYYFYTLFRVQLS